MTLFLKEPGTHGKRYLVRDHNCIGMSCFSPGEREIGQQNLLFGWSNFNRHNKSSNLINANICTHKIDHGCPEDITLFDLEKRKKMVEEGWSIVRM